MLKKEVPNGVPCFPKSFSLENWAPLSGSRVPHPLGENWYLPNSYTEWNFYMDRVPHSGTRVPIFGKPGTHFERSAMTVFFFQFLAIGLEFKNQKLISLTIRPGVLISFVIFFCLKNNHYTFNSFDDFNSKK